MLADVKALAKSVLTVAGALWRAVRGGGEFRRTPKFGVEGREAGWRSKSYFRPQDRRAQVELVFGVAGLVLGYAALSERAIAEGIRRRQRVDLPGRLHSGQA